MDLRLRLVAYLSGLSLALLAVAGVVVALTLHEDVAEEVEASARLAELMLTVSEAREQGTARLATLLGEGGLRHVAVSLARGETQPAPAADALLDRLAARLPLAADGVHERRIVLGDETLVIRADPRSEIREVLRDAARMLGTLAVFAVATVLLAWYAAHRALRPVRALEEGLARLARGETQVILPRFELLEFGRIAGAIDRLAASLAQSRAAEGRLARRLLELQECERSALARELHDEFGQSLTAIGVAAAYVERHAGAAPPPALVDCARDIRSEAGRMAGQVRGLLSQLRPHGLEGLGMVDALGELLAAWRQRAGIELEAVLPADLPPLAPMAGLALYRTLQEALTNVLRHSGARRVAVRLAVQGAGVELSVADNGSGRAADILRRAGGGLLGMRERAEMAGGRLTLTEARGGGLEVNLYLPGPGEGE